MSRVVFLTKVLTHYRAGFHERVYAALAKDGINYELIHGQGPRNGGNKERLVTLDWSRTIPNLYLGNRVVWQPAVGSILRADLAIVGQENSLLLNYPLQLFSPALRTRVALFGHGKNFQSRNPDGLADRWKAWWAPRCDWWFGYTDETRRILESLGFPSERITIFRNAIDTTDLRADAAGVTDARLEELRGDLGLVGTHVGIYVGGLYSEKRLEFLIEAADRIRKVLPTFELLVVGDGPVASTIQTAAASRNWLKWTGPQYGKQKAELLRLAHLFLMPGLLGLQVLDAGTCGLPIVTTEYPWHSPEIAYLRPGVNAVFTRDWQSSSGYAADVVALFENPHRMQRMAAASQFLAARHSLDDMAQRFVAGVRTALQCGKRL